MNIEIISGGVEKLWTKLEGWGEGAIQMVPNLIVAIVVFFFFWILSGWVHKLIAKGFEKTELNESLENLLANMARVAVICLGFVLALAILELQKTVFSLLAGVGVIGLALGFAFQDLAANFMSGIMLAVRAPVKLGDVVEINGIQGTIEDVRLRDTLIRNFDGQDVFIPNKYFTSEIFTNFSSFGKRKVTISVGIGYEDNPKKGLEKVHEALKSVENILSDPAPAAYLQELGGSSVNIIGSVWFEFPSGSFLQVRSDTINAVKTQLVDAGFNIPFPIRTLDIPEKTLEQLTRPNQP